MQPERIGKYELLGRLGRGTSADVYLAKDTRMGWQVTFLGDEAANGKEKPNQGTMIRYGMYAGPTETTEEDFKLAEFHGDPDNGLDWSGL